MNQLSIIFLKTSDKVKACSGGDRNILDLAKLITFLSFLETDCI